MRKKILYRMGVLDLILVGLIAILSNWDRTNMIISMGVKAADSLLGTGKIVLELLFGAVTIIHLWWWWQARPAKLSEADKPGLQSQIAKELDLEEIRKDLLGMVDKRPTLAELLNQALEQIDSLYRKHNRLEDVTRRDKLVYDQQASAALQNTEGVMCANFVKILNYADLCDPKEKWSERSSVNESKIQEYLNQNKKLLDQCGDLIAKTVDFGDGQVDSPDVKSIDISATLAVLDELLQKIDQAN